MYLIDFETKQVIRNLFSYMSAALVFRNTPIRRCDVKYLIKHISQCHDFTKIIEFSDHLARAA